MKIAFFTDTFYPEVNGVATSCLTLKRALQKRGHEVHVFAPQSKLGAVPQDPRVHLLPSVPLVFLKDRNWAVWSAKALQQIVPMGFDVIHTHSEFAMGVLGMRVARSGGSALVHTYHTVWQDYTGYISRGVKPVDKAVTGLARSYSRWWCNRCDMIVTPTAKTRDLLRGYGERTDISIVPSGMELGRFAPERHPMDERAQTRQECGVKPNERVLLYIGRLAPEKNLEQLMRVFPSLLSIYPDVRFVIVGEGPSRKTLGAVAEKLGVAEHVTLTGPKPWTQIDRYYAMGDVFCSCSHSETQGLTYIEAMASGLCVTAIADPCLQGVIEDGLNGFLAQDTDESLLQALDKAFGPAGAAIRAQAPLVAARYGTEAFARAIEEAYLAALSNNARIRRRYGARLAEYYHAGNRKSRFHFRAAGRKLKTAGRKFRRIHRQS